MAVMVTKQKILIGMVECYVEHAKTGKFENQSHIYAATFLSLNEQPEILHKNYRFYNPT